MSDQNAPIRSTIDDIEDATGDDKTTLGELLDSFESRSLGAILVIFGLLAGLPVVGAIPGVPDVAAAVVLFAVVHSFVGGQQYFWAPGFIRRREIESEKVQNALDKARPYARWVDGFVVNDRLSFLVETRLARVLLSLTAAVLAVLMFVLSIVPFAATPVAIGYLVLGLALMGRDGIFALAGYVLAGICFVLLFYLWGSIFGG